MDADAITVPDKKLGKLEAKFLKGLPAFGKYTTELPAPPLVCKYSTALQQLGSMANTDIGDCTCAAVGHAIQVWTSLASSQVVLPDATIISLYSKFGYVPGDPNSDNGAAATDVLLYWYKNPVAGHTLDGFASIRPGNRTSIRDAIYLFGICYLGVQLPLTAQNGDWILPAGQALTGNWARGSWGGHAIPACDYDADTLTVISWGKLVKVSWNWLDAFCDEAYALLSKDWITKTGNSPPGFDWLALQNDMNSFRVSP
jgi:hypothetical protein